MGRIACTLNSLMLTSIRNGLRYHGPCDSDGFGLRDVKPIPTDQENKRYYYCKNCMHMFDGEEAWAAVKAHLGTFPENDYVDPFDE